MQSSQLKVKINSRYLTFLKFILEGYDHLAVLTVLDGKKGLVKINFYYTQYDLIMEILEDLKERFKIKFL